MSDFSGLLSSDYGFKPSGKAAPMSSSSSSSSKPPPFDLGSTARSTRTSASFSDDRDPIFGPPKGQDFENIFGGSARFSGNSSPAAAAEPFNLDSIYGADSGSRAADSGPVFDKPVYDDDIFDGVAGLKSSAASDIFSSVTSPPPRASSSGFDDLLGGFGKAEAAAATNSQRAARNVAADFDELLPGFGGRSSSPRTERSNSEANWPPETTANVSKTTTSNVIEDPFGVSGQYSDPLEEISRLSNSGSLKADNPSVDNRRVFDNIDPFDGLGKSVPAFSSGRSFRGNDSGNLKADTTTNNGRGSTGKESTKSSVRSPDNQSQRKAPVGNQWDSHQTLFDVPSVSTTSHKSAGQTTSPPSYVNVKEENVQMDRSSRSEENLDSFDNIWLTVSEIPLMTQPTSAPPPSRPPPPRPVQVSKSRMSSPASTNSRRKASESSTDFFQAPKSTTAAARGPGVSSVDNFDDFAMGKSQSDFDGHVNGLSGEELERNSVTDAVKDAMDRAEFKFRQAKERGSTKSTRSKEAQEKEKERLQRESEEEDMERLEKERETERVLEDKEREQRKIEKERERAREMQENRQAVERATREARERAASEARLKAERAKAERAAVDRANAEARARAERAAVQRVQSEARERAAAEAKVRAEKAAAEAREREREARDRAAAKSEAEVRTRSERAAVERAAAEARERANATARANQANQQRNENDLENFFNMGRASSAPRPRANSSNRQEPEVPKTSTSSNIKKASSTTNIVDDLSSIFGAAPSSNEFQEVDGESEERRRARLERHQRTKERTVKALAEKNERDLQAQREQAERHRIAETLDVEIKRWAAGKEGNLRALLSTMQYVLWPECGWQTVSLTDMINAAQVKKVYRKATLCIHPDKVQQKGANLQQKYVAEKVFDLLKEAWNKFNSEELF
ncbi:auxilin-related protein 2-like isoform X2 [Argentina anserina]|uniref:auxilin-related protein 2-like isoform X2 n=1 Tax=Argentina anserina TaxID=57926 RepID=UPI0021762681|nr:auxilin-related protein 2-like isoform X2 [Potentilla anserina]